ncbi:MAG: NUDIX hydrolase [Syntrophales bacterium LBB04]|nr:NUDIX hydrolase [Syntrophales bacterium LBB04]
MSKRNPPEKDPGLKQGKRVYRSRVFDVFEGDVTLPDGRVSRQSWIDHRPCIAVVPIDREGRLVLIRQYRPAVGRMLIEIPAGNMDREAESVEACVQRELAEETGFKAGRLVKLFEGYLTPGYCNEYMYYYLAADLFEEAATPDADEYIELMTATIDQAKQLIKEGSIVDSKTALAIYLTIDYLKIGES